MKVSTLIQAAALIAIASTPAHAYFINYYPAGFNEGVSATLKTRTHGSANGIFNQQAFAEPSIARLAFSSSHEALNSYNSIHARNATAKTSTTNQSHNKLKNSDVDSVAEITQKSNFSHAAADSTNGYGLWPIKPSDVEKLAAAGQGTSTPGIDKWKNKLDKNRDISWSDNPYAPSPVKASSNAAVPEPASLGLVTLGLSALALSRRRAHRKSA